MVFVYVAVNRPKVTDDSWIYLPERDLTVHRLSEFKNFSPENAPADRTMLCAEITCGFDDAIWRSPDEELILITKGDLARIGLVRP
jgi:protoporphyrinogen oxidase